MRLADAARLVLILLLSSLPLAAPAQGVLTVRSALEFEDSLPILKASIEAHGYTVSHVQRCDSGLQSFGYKTDRYFIVFFGKFDEVRGLGTEFPALIPFLPLKMALFAEGEQSIVSAINPVALSDFYPDKKLQAQFQRWEQDVRAILAAMQKQDSPEGAAKTPR